MISSSLTVDRSEFEAATGWQLKPEGACKGEVCVPLAEPAGETVQIDALAPQLGMGVAHDEAAGLWAVGPAALGGRALATIVAPNLTLPDLDGNMFELDSLRGQKVLLVAWSPY